MQTKILVNPKKGCDAAWLEQRVAIMQEKSLAQQAPAAHNRYDVCTKGLEIT